MVDAKLKFLWDAVRIDFERARTLLPNLTVESEGSISRLDDWLNHNELGLALDELKMLGDENTVPSEYWQVLASAARKMNME